MRVKLCEAPRVLRAADFCAVVLAAGAGRRFGGAKLSAPLHGGALLDGALAAAFASPTEQVVVVSGADPAVASRATAFADARGAAGRLSVVAAPGWGEGLAASLRTGLAAVPPQAEAAFVFLGDMPAIPHDLAARLAERFTPGIDAVQPSFKSVAGHPVLIGRSLFSAVQALSGDRGARALLQGARVAEVEVEAAGVLLDVDTPAALAALHGEL